MQVKLFTGKRDSYGVVQVMEIDGAYSAVLSHPFSAVQQVSALKKSGKLGGDVGFGLT